MKAVIPTIQLLLKTSGKNRHREPSWPPEKREDNEWKTVRLYKLFKFEKDAARSFALLGRKIIFVPHFRFAEI